MSDRGYPSACALRGEALALRLVLAALQVDDDVAAFDSLNRTGRELNSCGQCARCAMKTLVARCAQLVSESADRDQLITYFEDVIGERLDELGDRHA